MSSRKSSGINPTKTNRVIPLIGHEVASNTPDPIASISCLIVLDISTNLNFFGALAITILSKIINIYL